MKISKYSLITFPVVYIVLGYTMFAIKYASPIDTPLQLQDAFIHKFINSTTHLWHLKIVIALVVAVMVNIIVSRRNHRR